MQESKQPRMPESKKARKQGGRQKSMKASNKKEGKKT